MPTLADAKIAEGSLLQFRLWRETAQGLDPHLMTDGNVLWLLVKPVTLR